MEKKLIMFDYDGVIVDSFFMLKKIYLDIAGSFSIHIPNDDLYFRELFELDWRHTLKKMGLTSKEDIDKIQAIYREGLMRYGNEVKPYTGIKDVLSSLSSCYTLALVTNNIRKEIEKRLSLFGMESYFSAFYTEEDGELKPSPDLVLKCMKRFGAAPSESAFIGDMDGDIMAAKAAGVGKIIAVTYGYHLHHRLKDADTIIDSPNNILKVFR